MRCPSGLENDVDFAGVALLVAVDRLNGNRNNLVIPELVQTPHHIYVASLQVDDCHRMGVIHQQEHVHIVDAQEAGIGPGIPVVGELPALQVHLLQVDQQAAGRPHHILQNLIISGLVDLCGLAHHLVLFLHGRPHFELGYFIIVASK